MITREAAATYFRTLLSGKLGWEKLKDSQFVGHLAVFVSWCLREALWRLERLNQEFFISTAINESSLLAHAEDRDYIPTLRIPASGKVTITSAGALSLPVGTVFECSQQLFYTTLETVNLTAAGSATIAIEQKYMKAIEGILISNPTPFHSYLLSLDDSLHIAQDTSSATTVAGSRASLAVSVDEGDGQGYVAWTYKRLFLNALSTDTVYDQFFSHTGQVGIRFGNGVFGKIPAVNSKLKIIMYLTEGDVSLAYGQTLTCVPASDTAISTDFTAIVSTSVENGSFREGTETIRANLRYWPTYQEKLVWNDDYVFFLKRNLLDYTVLWCKAWGEGEQEKHNGYKSIYNINRIFISAYPKPPTPEKSIDVMNLEELAAYNATVATAFENFKTAVIGQLEDVDIFNRHFTFIEPVYSSFNVSIVGKVTRTTQIADVTTAIQTALISAYGKDSTTRRERVFVNDIYSLINATGYFDQTYFTVAFPQETPGDLAPSVSGEIAPAELNEMVCIDETSLTITIEYL